ncbi:MAG: ribbon-helix-helix domain-containing protein [Promethearchaeota archaeon]
MKLITCHVPEQYLAGIESLVNLNVYPNRSEVIRVAIRDLLKAELGTVLHTKPE